MKFNSILFILIVCAYNTQFIYASEHCISSDGSEDSTNQCSKHLLKNNINEKKFNIKDKRSFTSKLWKQFTKRFDSYSDHIHTVTSVTGQNSAEAVASGTGMIVGAGVGIARSGNDLAKSVTKKGNDLVKSVNNRIDKYVTENITTINEGFAKKCKNIFIRYYFKISTLEALLGYKSTYKLDNDKWLGKINDKGTCGESVELTSNSINLSKIDSLEEYEDIFPVKFPIYLKQTMEKRCETINTNDSDHPCYHIMNTISWFKER